MAESVERFDLYGEDISLTSDYVSVAVDDPLSGELKSQAMNIRLWVPEPQSPRRLRLIIAESDGRRIAASHFIVSRYSTGASGRGFSATLKSSFGLLTVKQQSELRDLDGDHTGTTSFAITASWRDLVAVQIVDEIHFARAIVSPRKLVLAGEFTGPFTDVLEFDNDVATLVPEWVEVYAKALANLQEYADVPLRLTILEGDDGVHEVEHTIRLASLFDGNIIGQVSPSMGIQLAGVDLQDAVVDINSHNRIQMESVLAASVANGHVVIPEVVYLVESVTARIGAVGGVEQIILAPLEGENVTVKACLKRFVLSE